MLESTLDELTPDVVKKVAGLRLAHKAIMMADLNQVLSQTREMMELGQEKHRRDLGLTAAEATQPKEAEVDEMIHVGDLTIYQSTPAQAASQPTGAPPGNSAPAKSGLGALAKLALAGGLLVSGAGLGALPWLAGLAGRESLPQEVPKDTDTDTTFDLEIVPNEPAK